jgi:catechol 2,3-dioxygenase-like lactoylglutathione lyase family enzyme
VPEFPVTRAAAILAVSDFAASLRFYRDQLGLVEVALYDDPGFDTSAPPGETIWMWQRTYSFR